jgi:hypothetical protein
MSEIQEHIPNPEDPVSREAGRAIAHLNADHSVALLATTPAGEQTVRVRYAEPIEDAEGLRKATVKLAMRAREELV